MTVNELIDVLWGMQEEGHGDCEVRFVYQKNYPLQDLVKGVYYDDGDNDDDDSRLNNTIYLVSGGQCHDDPYGPSEAFEDCIY